MLICRCIELVGQPKTRTPLTIKWNFFYLSTLDWMLIANMSLKQFIDKVIVMCLLNWHMSFQLVKSAQSFWEFGFLMITILQHWWIAQNAVEASLFRFSTWVEVIQVYSSICVMTWVWYNSKVVFIELLLVECHMIPFRKWTARLSLRQLMSFVDLMAHHKNVCHWKCLALTLENQLSSLNFRLDVTHYANFNDWTVPKWKVQFRIGHLVRCNLLYTSSCSSERAFIRHLCSLNAIGR